MKEMLLFGAGASKEAGVPTAYGLTQDIANEFRLKPNLKRHSRVVSFVLGGLLFNRGIQGDDPLNSGVNVEEFFNAIRQKGPWSIFLLPCSQSSYSRSQIEVGWIRVNRFPFNEAVSSRSAMP